MWFLSIALYNEIHFDESYNGKTNNDNVLCEG